MSSFEPPPALLTVNAFCRLSSVGRTKCYEEIKAGRLQAVKVGRSRRIPYREALRWIESLPSE